VAPSWNARIADAQSTGRIFTEWRRFSLNVESQSTILLFNFAPRRFRTVTEFQEPGKCFELFPGEFLDDAARRRIFWSGG